MTENIPQNNGQVWPHHLKTVIIFAVVGLVSLIIGLILFFAVTLPTIIKANKALEEKEKAANEWVPRQRNQAVEDSPSGSTDEPIVVQPVTNQSQNSQGIPPVPRPPTPSESNLNLE